MPISKNPSAPPRKGTASTSTSVTEAAPLPARGRERANGLAGFMQIGAAVCLAKGWYADCATIDKYAMPISTEVARLAEKEEKIGKALDFLTKTGPYAALIGVVLPFAAQMLANHKVIEVPPGVMGVVPPAALEAEVRTAIAISQMEAMLAQEQAEAELNAVKAKLNGTGGSTSHDG